MLAEPRSSDPVDPLSAYSGLALFPRTFGVAPDPSKPYDPDTDLDAIHNHLKSLALQCPNKFLEEAKMVLDGSSELANYPAIKEKNGAVEDKESLQARRPALGRKRARFFLKSNLIQPTESLEPSLDIEQLKDPEEFFLAYERLENAKRELQKQIGVVSLDLNQHNPSKTARQRRPGILGRSVRYKHRYSSLISENNENILSSQETFDSGIVSPTNDISHCKTDQDLASKERYTAGSMDNPESKVSEILDELLSGNFEDLEGDRAVSILQKRLQIKPIDLEKLNLPEFRDIQKINLKSSRQNMPRPRKALADIDNMLKGISSKSHVKLIPEAESPFNHKSSPTLPTSLSASLSVLQRQILSSKSSNDPFPNPDFGHSPAKNSSSTECTLKESDLDHTGMQLSNCDELKSPLVEEDNIDNLLKGISSKTLVKLIQEAKSPFHHRASPTPPRSPFASLSLLQRQILQSKPSNDPFSIPDFGDSPAKNSSPIECMQKESDLDHTGMQPSNCNELKSPLVEEDDIATAKTGSQDVAIEDVTCTSEAIVHDNSSKLSFCVDVGSSGTYVDMEDNVGGSMDIEVTDEQLSRHDADIDAQEISLLQRQILQSRPSNDPFSIPYFGHSPAKNSSPIECMPKESDLDHTGMQLSNCNELKSPLVGVDDIATAKTSSQDVAIEDVTCTSEAIVHDNCSKLSFCVDVRSSGTHVDMEDNVGDSMDIEVTNEQLSRHDADIDAQENGSNKLEDKVEDMLQEPVEAVASPECSVNMVDSTGENSNCIRTPLDQSNPAVVEDHAVHGLSQAPDNVPEQNIEKIQESIEVSLNKQIKAKSRLHKNKEHSRRQSLAGAGLLWKSGLRRSTRIRTRPLEYWKGERLLYGRIHQSLTTVIGLKYVSPTKGDDGKPALKVKSYVSDEYKELVELAALH